MVNEKLVNAFSGWLALGTLIPILGLAVLIFIASAQDGDVGMTLISAVTMGLDIFLLAGLFTVAPNQGRVLQLFGKYIGTVRDPGLRWANPFYSKQKVSLGVRNFETERSKVNDTDGNPDRDRGRGRLESGRHR